MTRGWRRTGLGLAGLVIAGVLAAAPTAAASAPDEVPTWSPGQSCPDAIVIGAAGSGQLEMPSELGMGRQVDGLMRAIANAGPGLEIAAYPLPYPAAAVFPVRGYLASVELGLEALPTAVGEIARLCPATGIVLVGYSQGAHVLQVGLERIRATEWGGGDHADHVDAVVLLASPLFTRQAGLTQFGGFDPELAGVLGARDLPAWIVEDTLTWCLAGDQVCQAGDLADWLAYADASDAVHGTYDDPIARRILANLVVTRLAEGPAPPSFFDVPAGHGFAAEILTMAWDGIIQGYPDGTFRPTVAVTRQAAAAFLWRMEGEPSPSEPAGFSDVPVDHPFHEAIAWMVEQDITDGYRDGTFRPGAPVTRQAAAAFLWRAEGEPDIAAPAGFSDVPADHPFREAIAWMVDQEMTTGWSDQTFRPGRDVTRQSMAAFLARRSYGG